ncbi:MAG: hypothetical protein B0W54_03585 [Cellvibrio sp. 79]|nr:MAG: hypothetical protein B0W54_03585 [Cellvibrio sp. 79]
MTKAKLLIALLWAAALVLAGWTLAQLPFGEILTNLKNLRARDYFILLSANLAIILIFNLRWAVLGNAIQAPVNFFQLLLIRQAGQTVSFITPGPQFGGEPLQIFWLWRKAQLPLHKALLSLGLDRFYELWVNFSVLLLGVLLLLTSSANTTADWSTIFVVLIIVLALLTLFGALVFKQPLWLAHRLNKITHNWQAHRYLSHIKTHWNLLGDDLRTCLLHQKKRLAYAALLSVFGWIGLIGELQLILWLTDTPLTFTGFLLLFVALRLALLLPLPGGIGTMEAAVFWAFHYLNLPMESALTMIALMRLRDVMVLVFGFGCLGFIRKRTETQKAELTLKADAEKK